jgi:prepilin-type processing-associated H-X9-DG protein
MRTTQPSLNHSIQGGGFTLVEMLVVLGIIIIVAGLLMPAVMKARRSSRQAACASNLRQIGQMVLMYADANEDLLPMGQTAYPEPGHDPMSPEAKWISSPAWTCYLVVGGAPSCNLGPLFGARMFSAENAKVLYCPNDADERLTWKRWRDKYPPRGGEMPSDRTIRISYFARPLAGLFRHTLLAPPAVQVLWPGPTLPRLGDLQRKSLYAERNSHGNEGDPRINVLFYDGSVKYVMMKRPRTSSGGGTAETVYTTPDHLPPIPEDESSSGSSGPSVITVFDWEYFDTQ